MPIQTGLPDAGPLAWAVRAGRHVFTAHIPIRGDGTFETGSFEAQAVLVFRNLEQAVTAAGATLRDVVQVQIYLTDIADRVVMNEVWLRFFAPPWPNRATLGISALAVPGIKIEVVATAVVGSASSDSGRG